MITSIKGVLETIGPDWADIAVGGVAVRVYVPASEIDQLGPPGSRVRLHTSLQVREDSLTLYGFLAEEGRSAFESLIVINGVGPRVALNVLSILSPGSLALAVSSGDTDALSSVPGVGKKIASRILLELKGKLGEDWVIARVAQESADVIEALTALGYSVAEARAAVASIPSGNSLPLEERVRIALQRMGSG